MNHGARDERVQELKAKSVVIVGAGVIGCNLAHELSTRGALVTVVDAGERGSGTSAASYGWVNSNEKEPARYSDLNVLGLAAHERVGLDQGWFHQTGSVEIAHSTDRLNDLEKKVERMNRDVYEAAMMSKGEVARLLPHLTTFDVHGGAFFPREGWIDTVHMCHSLLARAQAFGATFQPFSRVTRVLPDGVEVLTRSDTVAVHRADVVVLAAGNGIRGLLNDAGVAFPTLEPTFQDPSGAERFPTVGIVATTGPFVATPTRMIRAEGIAFRPARNGGVSLTDHPTGSSWHRNEPEFWSIPDKLLSRARRIYPALAEVSIENVSAGTRVLPADGLTIADWTDDEHRMYAVATHSGVTLAGHLAQVVADEVLTGERHPSLEGFGLARFHVQN